MARPAIVTYKKDVEPNATRLPDTRPTQDKLRWELTAWAA
jgi:hypothetical protein